MLARLGLAPPASWHAWIWLKLAIWTALGAAPVLVKRAERLAGLLLVLLPLVGLLAALLVLDKPGA
jgi:hypothetical protein